MATTFQIDPDTESQILSIGDEFLPAVARKVRDGEDLTDGEIDEYQEWLVGQVEPPPAHPCDHCGGPSVSGVCLDCGATDIDQLRARFGRDVVDRAVEWLNLRGSDYAGTDMAPDLLSTCEEIADLDEDADAAVPR